MPAGPQTHVTPDLSPPIPTTGGLAGGTADSPGTGGHSQLIRQVRPPPSCAASGESGQTLQLAGHQAASVKCALRSLGFCLQRHRSLAHPDACAWEGAGWAPPPCSKAPCPCPRGRAAWESLGSWEEGCCELWGQTRPPSPLEEPVTGGLWPRSLPAPALHLP